MDFSAFDRLLRVQGVLWLIALPLLVFSLVYSTKAALRYLRISQISGAVEPVRWLGMKPGDNWRRQGWQLLAVITAATAVVILLQMKVETEGLNRLFPLLPVILLLSLSNSLAEELIFRHTIVTVLDATRW